MAKHLVREGSYERAVFDAIPSAAFVVDRDARILDANEAAARRFGGGATLLERELCGHVLRCVHAEGSEGGCGTTDRCPACVVRNSVSAAVLHTKVVREKGVMELLRDGEREEIVFLVTAAPFGYEGASFALVILEDVTELMELRRILPICVQCKKVRNDAQFWEDVEAFLTRHSDVKFSHGLCPACAKKLYPDVDFDEATC